MEPTQILLFVVVALLTALLIAVGAQAFLILRGAKKTMDKLNKILEDAGLVSGAISRPVVGIANLIEGAKSLKGIVDFVADKTKGKSVVEKAEKQEQEYPFIEEESAVGSSHISALQERGRRFFHRGGKPLSS